MNTRVRSADELLAHFNWDVEHCRHVRHLAVELFDQLAALHAMTGRERDLLEAAALLHDIGWTVSRQKHHKHSAKLIRKNAGRLPGFDAGEVELIANIARYHRKAEPSRDHEPFAALTWEQQTMVRQLAALLRVADGLDRPHWQAVSALQCEITNGTIRVGVRVAAEPADHLTGARRKCGLFEGVFERSLDFFVWS